MPHYTMISSDYVRINAEIRQEYFDKYFSRDAQAELMRCFGREYLHMSGEKLRRYSAYADELIGKEGETGAFAALAYMLKILSDEYMPTYAPSYMRPLNTPDNEKLQSIVTHIERNYRDLGSLDEIAHACYISKSHMCHMFRKELGVSVIDYANSVKLRHACNLLADTNMNIIEIAVECGFNSSQYFSRIFKATSGCTPNQYRSRMKNRNGGG